MIFMFCKVKHRQGKEKLRTYYQHERYIKQSGSPQKHLQIHKYELHYCYSLTATDGHQATTRKRNSKHFQYEHI